MFNNTEEILEFLLVDTEDTTQHFHK